MRDAVRKKVIPSCSYCVIAFYASGVTPKSSGRALFVVITISSYIFLLRRSNLFIKVTPPSNTE